MRVLFAVGGVVSSHLSLAEKVRFELTEEFPPRRISSAVPSATRPLLHQPIPDSIAPRQIVIAVARLSFTEKMPKLGKNFGGTRRHAAGPTLAGLN